VAIDAERQLSAAAPKGKNEKRATLIRGRLDKIVMPSLN